MGKAAENQAHKVLSDDPATLGEVLKADDSAIYIVYETYIANIGEMVFQCCTIYCACHEI